MAKGLSNWSKDKYLLASGHEAAQKRLLAILTANPQDMTHPDFARPTRRSLSHLSEIRVPTLILVGDADIPDVHAHAGAIEAGIAGSKRMIMDDSGHLMYLEKPEDFSRVVIFFIESNLGELHSQHLIASTPDRLGNRKLTSSHSADVRCSALRMIGA